MKPQKNLQNNILNKVRKKKIPVIIYLMNGFQLKGIVTGFDNFTIILNSNGNNKLIYKHAISTIEPQEKIEDFLDE